MVHATIATTVSTSRHFHRGGQSGAISSTGTGTTVTSATTDGPVFRRAWDELLTTSGRYNPPVLATAQTRARMAAAAAASTAAAPPSPTTVTSTSSWRPGGIGYCPHGADVAGGNSDDDSGDECVLPRSRQYRSTAVHTSDVVSFGVLGSSSSSSVGGGGNGSRGGRNPDAHNPGADNDDDSIPTYRWQLVVAVDKALSPPADSEQLLARRRLSRDAARTRAYDIASQMINADMLSRGLYRTGGGHGRGTATALESSAREFGGFGGVADNAAAPSLTASIAAASTRQSPFTRLEQIQRRLVELHRHTAAAAHSAVNGSSRSADTPWTGDDNEDALMAMTEPLLRVHRRHTAEPVVTSGQHRAVVPISGSTVQPRRQQQHLRSPPSPPSDPAVAATVTGENAGGPFAPLSRQELLRVLTNRPTPAAATSSVSSVDSMPALLPYQPPPPYSSTRRRHQHQERSSSSLDSDHEDSSTPAVTANSTAAVNGGGHGSTVAAPTRFLRPRTRPPTQSTTSATVTATSSGGGISTVSRPSSSSRFPDLNDREAMREFMSEPRRRERQARSDAITAHAIATTLRLANDADANDDMDDHDGDEVDGDVRMDVDVVFADSGTASISAADRVAWRGEGGRVTPLSTARNNPHRRAYEAAFGRRGAGNDSADGDSGSQFR